MNHISCNHDYHSCVKALSLLDNLLLTNQSISDDDSPQVESMQVDDDHNDPMVVYSNMRSTEDDIDCVEKYLDRLKLCKEKKNKLEVLRHHSEHN